MTVRKRTATITLDAYGRGSEDVKVGAVADPPPARWAGLFAVEVTSDQSKRMTIDIRSLDTDDDDEVTDGELLFHVYDPRTGVAYQPRLESVSASVSHATSFPTGSATSEENVLPRIRTPYVRVDVEKGTALAEVTVDLFIETAGDQRF